MTASGRREPAGPALRVAAAALALIPGSALADITVSAARITEGLLWVIGDSDEPNARIVLDNAHEAATDRSGGFEFRVVYHPATCIVTLRTSSESRRAVVANCGQAGPKGEAGPAGQPGPAGPPGPAAVAALPADPPPARAGPSPRLRLSPRLRPSRRPRPNSPPGRPTRRRVCPRPRARSRPLPSRRARARRPSRPRAPPLRPARPWPGNGWTRTARPRSTSSPAATPSAGR